MQSSLVWKGFSKSFENTYVAFLYLIADTDESVVPSSWGRAFVHLCASLFVSLPRIRRLNLNVITKSSVVLEDQISCRMVPIHNFKAVLKYAPNQPKVRTETCF